jgi:hypothetical protein
MTMAVLLLAGASNCGGGGGPSGPWRAHAAPGTSMMTAVWAFAPDDVWVSGQSSLGVLTMLHFDGTAFTEVTTPALGAVSDFWGFAPNDLYATAGSSLMHWDGAGWSEVDFAGAIDPVGLTSVWGTSGGDLWLGDEQNGRVFRWDGATWSIGITQTVQVNDLWGVAGGPVFAGGLFGLSRWSGAAWTDVGDDVANEATGMWGFGAGDVWAASDLGTLAHWDGATWTDTLPADNPDFEEGTTSIWGPAPDDVWAVGDFGAISHWDGTGWSQSQYGTFPYYPWLSKVHGSSASDIWIVGRAYDNSSGLVLHYQP